MSVAKTNRKRVDQLRSGRSLKAVQAALDRGEITPRQAKMLARFIGIANRIQRDYKFSAVVWDPTEQYVLGEVRSRNRGATWIGYRYGPDFPRDSAEFADQDDAVRFVGGGDARSMTSAPEQ